METVEQLRAQLINIKKEKHLTNFEISDDVGCSETTIGEIISGRRKNVLPRIYFKIEKWLLVENNK